MDPGFRSPLVDLFRRGEAARDVRLLAAQGALAPRAEEQLALLIILVDDADPEIASTANATLDALPADSLGAFLAQPAVTPEMREFFAARGVTPDGGTQAVPGAPLLDVADEPDGGSDDEDADADEDASEDDDEKASGQNLSTLSIMQRMKLAMKGTRAQRAQLIRDSNKLVAAAVLSSPKLTEVEV